ncbi:hypothetical protein GZ78_02345 [Endozoicomonas numazuensis]|uniref:Uncharacterized protein n=1 Tax=Endozoicomonas numazuensis TaxID=1137799 RepID=A0A081NKE0_9GAMM|nr:hypothetical protein GZ78_02345 [Endozoicomonas numazuensis]
MRIVDLFKQIQWKRWPFFLDFRPGCLFSVSLLVFRKELYASISFIAAWIFFILCMTPLSMTACILITLITGFTARMLAITMNIELPILNFDQKPPKK